MRQGTNTQDESKPCYAPVMVLSHPVLGLYFLPAIGIDRGSGRARPVGRVVAGKDSLGAYLD